MTNNVDLNGILCIHNKMRTDTRRFATAVEQATHDDRATHLRALARWAVGFGHELHVHHTIEDDIVFPHLAGRVPAVRSLLADLEGDHETVARLLHEWGPAARAMADTTQDFTAAQVRMLEMAVDLRDLLARHLDIEDHDVFPLFAQHYTADEYDALHAQAMRQMPKTGLSFSIPWNVTAQPADQRAELLATAPLPLRLIYRATRGRYTRLVEAAFTGVPVPELVPV